MKKILRTFLNPVKLYKAYRYHKASPKYDKSKSDTELMLYSKILSKDMLHFGYFDDVNIEPDTISVRDIENAQLRYSEIMIEQITNQQDLLLDVGCGMGGLSAILNEKGYKVQALTPNVLQKRYINQKQPELMVHHLKFEELETQEKYGTIINSESLQYINLDIAFKKVDTLLLPGGRWLISDFFRIKKDTINKSGHTLDDFLESVKKHGWKIVVEQDVTLNALPTLKVVNFYYTRFLEPLGHFVSEKIRFKQPWLYYLTQEFRGDVSKKVTKELAAVDPEKFVTEKRYMFYVLERI